jgi:protein TonB
MFSELVESVAVKKQTSKPWTVAASAIFQFACLALAFLIPLIYTQALPKTILTDFLLAPAPSLPPASARTERPPSGRQRVRLFENGVVHEPTAVPPKVGMFQEAPLPPEDLAGSGMSGGRGDFDLLGSVRSGPVVASPQPPAPVATQRIKQGGVIEAAKIVSQLQPVYPTLARQASIQGAVLLQAVIDKDGRVSELQVLSGSPLLARAALDAVKQWRYQPTLLNGQPVEVETTITVSFVLGK